MIAERNMVRKKASKRSAKHKKVTLPRPESTSERMAALFLLGLLLFNPPLLNVFDAGAEITVFGIPLLYLYLFSAWAVLIFLTALAINLPHPRGRVPPAVDGGAAGDAD